VVSTQLEPSDLPGVSLVAVAISSPALSVERFAEGQLIEETVVL
jgi:hypothetical protein